MIEQGAAALQPAGDTRDGLTVAINGTPLAAGGVPALVDGARCVAADGFEALWVSQGFGADALVSLAVVGREVPTLDLGTAVVPVFLRHPQALAAEVLTLQSALQGQLLLGLGLSHRPVVEECWGLRYDRPVAYLREYLSALVPLLNGEPSELRGEQLTCVTSLDVPAARAPSLLLAAMGPQMLRLAGAWADGTIVGNAGPRALSEHVVPRLQDAASKAGRSAPRVVVNAPVWVTDAPEEARARLRTALAAYGRFAAFRAMLDREGAAGPEDVALVGSEEAVAEQVRALQAAGATDLVAVEMAEGAEERARTRALLRSLAAAGTAL